MVFLIESHLNLNTCMKNLLLILVLSLLSIQSFAGSCSDGSEPVKSISADGTYFVFSCGGSNEQSSSFNTDSSNTKSNSNQAYQSFPVHEFAKSPLRDLKVPENWKLFKDPSELDLFHSMFKLTDRYWWKSYPFLNDCERATAEFDLEAFKSIEETGDRATFFIRCKNFFTRMHFDDQEEVIKVFERILLSWAKNKPIKYPDPNLKTSSFGDIAYAATMTVGDYASFYAVYYGDFNFNKEQRQAVDDYLSDWLINYDLEPNLHYRRCVLEEPERFEIEGYEAFGIYADYCGSNRWRMGLGAVYLGLRTGNQRLFTAGNRHIEINLASIDKDGIFPQWSRKGALALSYQRQLPEVLTLLALAYESIGYDFYEHQLPHGKKIHEVYEALFDFIYHPEKLNKYAFAAWDFVGQDAYAFDKLPLKEKWRREYIYPEVLAAQSKGYILRYRPDLMGDIDYSENWKEFSHEYVGVFVSMSGLAIYEAVNQNVSIEAEKRKEKKRIEAEKRKEEKRIEAEKKKEKDRIDAEKYKERLKVEKERLRVEAEVEAAACKASPLNGEYVASWYFGNQNYDLELEFQGLEGLILENCSGVFEGKESFQPSKDLRKDLNITFEPNGSIFILGELDLFDKGDARKTELKGDINSGEISGIWGYGDLIKIQIESKKESDEKKRIEAEKKKEEARLEAAACKASPLNGEYVASWYFGNINNNLELEFQGLEDLILENCSGVFEGKESFQPSKNLRKDLNITFDLNGFIVVSGELDLFEKGDARKTELKGDINSGEISGIWGYGDLIKIELVKK